MINAGNLGYSAQLRFESRISKSPDTLQTEFSRQITYIINVILFISFIFMTDIVQFKHIHLI